MWNADLVRLIQECRAMNEDQRFGQMLFNLIAFHDGGRGGTYDEDFHQRLFYIRDEELVTAFKEWVEFVEQQRSKKDTHTG